MRKFLSAILGVALLVVAFGAAPVTATNGNGTADLFDCDTGSRATGLKLYRDDNQSGGGPVMCGYNSSGIMDAGKDGNLGTRKPAEVADPYAGIWNFANEADSVRLLMRNVTGAITFCAWSGPQGSGNLTKETYMAGQGSGTHVWNINIPNDNAESVAWTTAGGSTPLTCNQVKGFHGW